MSKINALLKRSLLLGLVFLMLFAGGASAQTMQLPAQLLEIEKEAFCGNDALQNVVLPEKLNAIGARAFAECENMETIYIPSSVTYIAKDAFASCSNLTFRCEWGSYAAQYALRYVEQHPDCNVEMIGDPSDPSAPSELIPRVTVSRLLCEGNEIDLTWEIDPGSVMYGDLCQLAVILNGEEYRRFEASEELIYTLRESHETALTGEMYAICYCEHADGTTTQAISPKTQLAGQMDAALIAEDTAGWLNDPMTWNLSVSGHAGAIMVQYSLYKDGGLYEQSGYTSSAIYSVQFEEPGEYTAQAHVMDGLGRELAVQGNAIAIEEYPNPDPLFYSLNADGESYCVIGCDAGAKEIAIPYSHHDHPVTAIADYAFVACENLQTVKTTSNVTRIGDYAFHGCKNLYQVTLSGQEIIGEGAFSGCTSLTYITSLKEFPAYLFEGCTALESVTIPSGVTRIEKNAFAGCAALKSIALSNTVTEIGEDAFLGCVGLSSITLPNSVKHVGMNAFSGCTGLSSVTFGTGLVAMGEGVFSCCSALKSVSLPQGMENVPDSTFAGCIKLRDVAFSDTITSIGPRAFAGCIGIDEMVIPAGVNAVGQYAFAGCTNLELLTFDNENTLIADGALDYCTDVELHTFGSGNVERWAAEKSVDFRNTALPEITAAQAVTAEPEAGNPLTWQAHASWGTEPYTYAFEVYGNGELTASNSSAAESAFTHTPEIDGTYYAKVTVTDAGGYTASMQTECIEVGPGKVGTLACLEYKLNSSADAYIITGVKMGKDPEEIVIPAEIEGIPVTTIAENAFRQYEHYNYTSLIMPDSITTINNYAFLENKTLKKVVLSAGLSDVKHMTFSGCTNLEEVVIPYGVKTLGALMFSDCPRLKHVEIPDSVASIGRNAFSNCDALEQITIPAGVTSFGWEVFAECDGLRSVVWKGSTGVIPEYMFMYCKNLEQVEILAPVTEIKTHAFAGTAVKEIDGLDAVSIVDSYAFANCQDLIRMDLSRDAATVRIDDGAFENCGALEYVRMNDEALCSTGVAAFANCTSLQKVTCGVMRAMQGSFRGCTALKEAEVEYIGASCFEGCTTLERVIIRDNDYELLIPEYAFKDCAKLKRIEFASSYSLTDPSYFKEVRIYTEAFKNCASLEEFVLTGSRGLHLWDGVFDGCTSLKNARLTTFYSSYYSGEGCKIPNKLFKNCTALEKVYFSGFRSGVGDEAFKNCTSLKTLEMYSTGSYDSSYIVNELKGKIGSQAFANCESLTYLLITGVIKSNIGEAAFDGCVNLLIDPDSCEGALEYFAENPINPALTADTLKKTLTAEVSWGEVKKDNSGAYVTAKITAHNTKNGAIIYAGDWASTIAAAKMGSVEVTVSSPCLSVQYEGDSLVIPPDSDVRQVHSLGDIHYLGSKSATVILRCTSENPSKCDHGDLCVVVTADEDLQTEVTSAADVVFPNYVTGDLVIDEDTVFDVDTVVSGDIRVKALAELEGVKLSAGGEIRIDQGGTVKMNGSARLIAQELILEGGGGIDMRDSASIRAGSITDEGSIAMLSAGSRITADSFSVTGSGVLNMAADGRLTTDSFTFHTGADHTKLLTHGVIVASQAQIGRGYFGSKKNVFLLQGDSCTLSVERTSPKQRFAALMIDCKVGDLVVDGAGNLTGMPFECDHFSMSEGSFEDEITKSNQICKEIVDKFIEARMEAVAEKEDKLAKELEELYTVSLDMSDLDIDTLKEARRSATYAQKAVISWMIETSANAPGKWSNVNDIIQAITVTHTGGSYSFTDGDKTYEVTVSPKGGLSASQAAAGWGEIVCRCGSEQYTYVFALSPEGIKKSSEALLEIIREYAEDEYVTQINKAMEELLGKEDAKYAMALVKVLETSALDDKSVFKVIAEKYGKDIAKKLLEEKFPKLKKTIKYVTKWDKFIKKGKSLNGMVKESRAGNAMPSSIMKEFLDLVKLTM